MNIVAVYNQGPCNIMPPKTPHDDINAHHMSTDFSVYFAFCSIAMSCLYHLLIHCLSMAGMTVRGRCVHSPAAQSFVVHKYGICPATTICCHLVSLFGAGLGRPLAAPINNGFPFEPPWLTSTVTEQRLAIGTTLSVPSPRKQNLLSLVDHVCFLGSRLD